MFHEKGHNTVKPIVDYIKGDIKWKFITYRMERHIFHKGIILCGQVLRAM
jgi:hypothetical protein